MHYVFCILKFVCQHSFGSIENCDLTHLGHSTHVNLAVDAKHGTPMSPTWHRFWLHLFMLNSLRINIIYTKRLNILNVLNVSSVVYPYEHIL